MSVITKELHFHSLDGSIIGHIGCSLLLTTLSGSKKYLLDCQTTTHSDQFQITRSLGFMIGWFSAIAFLAALAALCPPWS